ncbi:uncharacterized protein LOC119289628 [Triticum dicoccoides]|uniref:uncharacterized protein LOC119289628 n=1 Tax=Triticum dicoccoides TaxID=85692 RepID=UPI00188FD214|nr:uncharacterized protein LOC119289628 [Triticum dicoccoides]
MRQALPPPSNRGASHLMASPARPASVSGPFALAPDLARCSFDHTLRREVQKCVQVLQDKQELAETQNELAKLQIVYEDPAQKSEGTAPSVFMARENDGSFPGAKHELAIVLLHQSSQRSPAGHRPKSPDLARCSFDHTLRRVLWILWLNIELELLNTEHGQHWIQVWEADQVLCSCTCLVASPAQWCFLR